MLIIRHVSFYLVCFNLPSNATWAQNATTVAGQADGTSGSSTNYLDSPHTITISTDNILYVTDVNNNRVVMVNLTSSTVIGTIGSGPGSGITQFNGPGDLSTSQQFLYVLDTNNYRIQKWSTNGTNPSTVPGANTFGTSDFMFIDKFGNLYISDIDNSQVSRFAPNSSVPVRIAGDGTAGSQSNQLNTPYGLYVDDNLTLYIADGYNNRIQMWKSGASVGSTVAGNGQSGTSLRRVSAPGEIVVDINGYMYIADSANYRIVRWAPNSTIGVCIAGCTFTSGTNANQLGWPTSLTFDDCGSLYVTDMANNRVQKFQILNNQCNTIAFSWL